MSKWIQDWLCGGLAAATLAGSGCLSAGGTSPAEPQIAEPGRDVESRADPQSALRPAPAPPPRVLKWVDDDGVVHYRIEFPDADSSAPAPQPAALEASAELPDRFGSFAGLRADGGEELSATLAAIRELEAQILRDRELLKQLISQRSPVNARSVSKLPDARLREVAERLPRLQSELEALKRETGP